MKTAYKIFIKLGRQNVPRNNSLKYVAGSALFNGSFHLNFICVFFNMIIFIAMIFFKLFIKCKYNELHVGSKYNKLQVGSKYNKLQVGSKYNKLQVGTRIGSSEVGKQKLRIATS